MDPRISIEDMWKKITILAEIYLNIYKYSWEDINLSYAIFRSSEAWRDRDSRETGCPGRVCSGQEAALQGAVRV